MHTNPILLKTKKQQREKRQPKKHQQEQRQETQQTSELSLTEEKPATALPSLEDQLDCLADLLIDLYLHDQQKETHDEDEQSETNND